MFNDGINISQAADLPEELSQALERWRAEASRVLDSGEVNWYSKLVSTDFDYNGISYKVEIGDVFSKDVMDRYGETCSHNRLEAVLESIQLTIRDDLRELGAENILNYGLLD